MADLHLALKGEYFDLIKAGKKPFEFREMTPYWVKRLVNRDYENVIFTRGYPRKDDAERRIKMPYRGYVESTIKHPHFGSDFIKVFAIHSALT